MSEELPFVCPSCGTRFGYGSDAILLSVVSSTSFNENLPCCGVRAKGTVIRNKEGFMEIQKMEVVA